LLSGFYNTIKGNVRQEVFSYHVFPDVFLCI